MAVHTLHKPRLSREERIGLGVAIVLHLALIAWLTLDRLGKDIQAPPERMTVSFADEIAPETTSPEPLAQAAPDVAPTLGEAQPEPEPVAIPAPEPVVRPASTPQSRLKPPAAKPTSTQPRRRPDTPSGASRVGSDFLKGVAGGEVPGRSQNPPAARAGSQVAASLRQAVARQLKPHWVAPQGVEADQLVTILRFSLNRDGSLAARPTVVDQSGVTAANRPQQARHAEQAIRAVQLAAPFDLPEEFYAQWKTVTSRFDRKLSL